MEEIIAKTIMQRTRPDMISWFYNDYNMNLYRGCSHGCIYCDSRSLCYGIDHFDTIKPKKSALAILESELRRKRIKGICGMGSMSDPYNPLETTLELTREALKLFIKYGYGVSIITKSATILRDLDLLKTLNERQSVLVNITITTADEGLQKIIEPRSSTTLERFEAIQILNENGIKAGITLMPILPYINDDEQNLLHIIELAKAHKANHIYAYFGVTMRDRQRDYLYQQFDTYFPGVKQKYQQIFKDRYSCYSPNHLRLYELLTEKCNKYNILHNMKDINQSFMKQSKQLSLNI